MDVVLFMYTIATYTHNNVSFLLFVYYVQCHPYWGMEKLWLHLRKKRLFEKIVSYNELFVVLNEKKKWNILAISSRLKVHVQRSHLHKKNCVRTQTPYD